MKKYRQKKKLKRNNIDKFRETVSEFLSKDIPSPIIVIAGVTGSGKSSLALKLCNEFNGFVINADSRQIYKQLKIGSAQPIPDSTATSSQNEKFDSAQPIPDSTTTSSQNEKIVSAQPVLNSTTTSQSVPNSTRPSFQDDSFPGECWIIDGIKHFLYGHVNIMEKYTLYRYQKEVEKIIEYKRKTTPKQIPFLVGGTGLYINAIIKNYNLKKESFDPKQRKRLEKKSLKELQFMIPNDVLNKLNNSDRNNPYRLIRIIEKDGNLYDRGDPMSYLALIVEPDNQDDYEKGLQKRIDRMFAQGLVEENVKIREELKAKGVNIFPRALNAIGYAEFNDFFSGSVSLGKVKGQILLHSRQFAKRQATWFRNKL